MGVEYKSMDIPGEKSSLIFFDMYESNNLWPEIADLISIYKPTDIVDTFFSDEEIKNATWLRLVPSFEQGYPEPKPQWPIKQETHELICKKCAIRRQTGSFRISKEPKLKDNFFMTLVSCGEIFAVPEVFKEFSKNSFSGYEASDVLNHKTGLPSPMIKQIQILDFANPGLIEDENTQFVDCENCSTRKYLSHMRGMMQVRKKAFTGQSDFLLSHEWFGSGLIAYHECFISNRVGRLILNNKWKGVRLKPVKII
ncbi:MAG: hypothetical protein U0Z26_18495 [Anaerolineales bacterium]